MSVARTKTEMATYLNDRTLTQALAGFVSHLRFEDIPDKVVHDAKFRILDVLGCALRGSMEPSSKTTVDLAVSLGGKPESTIISQRERSSCANAALVNGTMAHSLELDDSHRRSWAHPGVVTIPAGLALTEKMNLSGKILITSTVVGYEVLNRIGIAIRESGPFMELVRGWHATGPLGVFGAAATGSKILGLDESRTANALGIAGSQASGLYQVWVESAWSPMSWVKRFHAGWASSAGIIAALLSQRGYTSPLSILEGKLGFYHAFVDDKFDARKLTKNLGRTFEIAKTAHKPYAGCDASHALIDAAIGCVEENNIAIEEIESIEGRTNKHLASIVAGKSPRKYTPQSVLDAQFSAYYVMSLGMIFHRVLWDELSQNLSNPKVLELAKKIKVVADPKFDKGYPELWGAAVTIRTKGGRKFTYAVKTAKGDPMRTPMTDEELKVKFRTLASKVLGTDQIEQIIKTVEDLDKLGQIDTLTNMLRPD